MINVEIIFSTDGCVSRTISGLVAKGGGKRVPRVLQLEDRQPPERQSG